MLTFPTGSNVLLPVQFPDNALVEATKRRPLVVTPCPDEALGFGPTLDAVDTWIKELALCATLSNKVLKYMTGF